MKQNSRRFLVITLSIALSCSSVSALAGKNNSYVAAASMPPVSSRLIVKFKPNSLPKGLSVAQIATQLGQPLTVQNLSRLQTASGARMSELHALFNGAHVMFVDGKPDRKALDQAIAGIAALSDVEYVEEDKIMTVQAAPNDIYYSSGPGGTPGLWGLWPVSAAASPSPGSAGSYGADFETAWNSSTGNGVVVAVVDTGIRPHPDIVGPSAVVAAGTGSNLASSGYDFITDCRYRGTCPPTTSTASAYVAPSADATDTGDYLDSTDCAAGSVFYPCTVSNSSWHGTHVAGIIAALGNNSLGVIGGAYNARILPVRVMGKGGGFTSDIANGIMWAAGVSSITSTYPNPNPAKVINLSLGGSGACTSTEQAAINAAVAAGAVVVVAAGNDNADVANADPANCQNVISVAAIARDGSRAAYSNFSSPASNITNPVNVTLAAQGGDQTYAPTFDPGILSTVDSGTTVPSGPAYAYYQGTSMATPHVSAVAALMIANNSLLTPAQIKTILSAPSSLTTFPSFSSTSGLAAWDCATNKNCGAGILNANLAVQNSAPTALTAAAAADFGSVLVNGSVNKTVTLTNTGLVSEQLGATAITGSAYFTLGTNTCTGVIVPNGTCQVTLTYAPTAAGAHTANLSVSVNGAAAPTLVALAGSAGSTALTTSTPTVSAATVTVGQSTTVNLSYTNPNGIALKTGAVTLDQPAIMATSADACSNTTLAAGASCPVTVTITPTAAGSYGGTATLGLSGGGTPAVATISGIASAPVAASSGGGGGGGCSIMPVGADPDLSVLLAVLAVGVYGLRRRFVRTRDAA